MRERHTYYARTNKRGADGKFRVLAMHRLITDAPDDMIPNHEDGNGLNNTRKNLVLMTKGDNNRHRVRKRNTPITLAAPEIEDWRAMQARYGNRIPLGSYKYPGLFAIVDEEDYERVARWKWTVVESHGNFYAVRRGRDETGTMVKIAMHRFIMGATPVEKVDHIHGNGLDNRKAELRKCTNAENARNRRLPSNNTSGYKGASLRIARQVWAAHIGAEGKLIHLGYHPTVEAAARAYDAKARELFGDYARLNFPGD